MQLTMNEKQLLLTLKTLVATERKTLSDILKHLQTVYDTRLFAKLGYSNVNRQSSTSGINKIIILH